MEKTNWFSFVSMFLFLFLTSCSSVKMGKDLNIVPEMTKIDNEALKMFPEAKKGFVRKVIALEKMENENNYKIEFYTGKDFMVDCNYHRLSGELEKQSLKGYGYHYYEFSGSADLFSTRRACPDTSLVEKFISSTPVIVPYNRSVPLVVYIPADMDLRFNIWTKGGKEFQADSF